MPRVPKYCGVTAALRTSSDSFRRGIYPSGYASAVFIALRHMKAKKNWVDQVRSTPYVPFPDILAFVPEMNETIKPFLAAKGHSTSDVEGMHRAWVKSLQLRMALWAKPYSESAEGHS